MNWRKVEEHGRTVEGVMVDFVNEICRLRQALRRIQDQYSHRATDAEKLHECYAIAAAALEMEDE